MNFGELPIERLLELARTRSPEALEELFRRHREPLRKMLAVRMDMRLQSRVDASDIVQETLIEANRRIDEYYIDERAIAFYPWLRQIALNRMIDAYRRHIIAKRREVGRQNATMPNAGASGIDWMNSQPGSITSPSGAVERNELQENMRAALAELNPTDRELIVLRHLKRLSTRETAEALNISEAAVKTRLLRALRRLRAHLGRHGYE